MAAMGAAFPTQNYSQPNHVLTAPAVSRSYPTDYQVLSHGDGATFQTLDAMAQAVLTGLAPEYVGYQDPTINRAANQIAGFGQNSRNQIAALFDFAARQIRYVEHPFNVQVIQDAKRTMEIGSGDCVSLSVLLATLLASLNFHPRFVAQWPDGQSASHVYVEVLLDGDNWLALDAVASDKPIGWRQQTLDGGFECPWEIF
jgi:transglutaminase-like putative cysteine protease